MQCPEEVRLSREDGEALRTRLAGDALTAADRRVLDQVLQWYFWLLFALQEATFSLKRLRVLLFGAKSHTRKTTPPLGSRRTPGMALERWAVLRRKACRRPWRPPTWRDRRLLASDTPAMGGRRRDLPWRRARGLPP